MTTSTFKGQLKNNYWLPHVQQEIFQRDSQLHVFPKKKQYDLFSESKKSLLRNTKSNKSYVLYLGRHVNRCAHAIACLLLTGLIDGHAC